MLWTRRAALKKTEKIIKLNFNNFLSFIFLEVLILERYYTAWNYSWYEVRKSKIQYFKVISKSIKPTERRKKLLAEIFGISECLLTKTQIINILNFLDSSELYKRLLVNPKTESSMKLIMPEDDFKTYSAKLLMPRDPTKMWNWDLKVRQIPLITWAQ